jgi:hypothetical protein
LRLLTLYLQSLSPQVEDRPFNRSASDSRRGSNLFRGYFVPHHPRSTPSLVGEGVDFHTEAFNNRVSHNLAAPGTS